MKDKTKNQARMAERTENVIVGKQNWFSWWTALAEMKDTAILDRHLDS